jgi:hypothetical protein
MRSEVIGRITRRIHRKTRKRIKALACQLMEENRRRCFYYFDWRQWYFGGDIEKINGASGYRYMIGLDFGPFSVWMYFVRINNKYF